MATSEQLLRSIDAKLGALLVLALDRHLRDTGIARPKERSVDKMLADVGLDTSEIAAQLGKTDRAVQMQLQKERQKRTQRTKRGGSGKGSS